jgi:hypothetical protein
VKGWSNGSNGWMAVMDGLIVQWKDGSSNGCVGSMEGSNGGIQWRDPKSKG